MTLRLFLFGPPTVEHGDGTFVLPFERRSQLLVFLALKHAWVGRGELAALLWPDQAQALALANLRKTLFRLQAWPWLQGFEVEGGALRFIAPTDLPAVDASRDGASDRPVPMPRGEFLAGFDDDANQAWTSWLGFERERLRAAGRSAALARLEAGIDPREAIDLSGALLEADPLDEGALHAHMTWLARDGQRSRAREAYRAFADRLARDLGLTPGAQTGALHDALGSAPAATLPPTGVAKTPPSDGFVGRSAELKRAAALIGGGECRLLTILGPGGVGKTRLAQRALHELAAEFPDGALFVPLEDLAAANEIAVRLARELELRPAGTREPMAHVIEQLRGQRVLVVLDNFEHLAPDIAPVARLLSACPGLALIVTSRVRLALPGEWLMPLEGLPCPEPEDHDRIEAFDAARLFVQTALRVEPALVPSTEATSIVDICRQVDGLPLAIELAAAWTRLMSCAEIAAELRHGSELLRAVDASHPPRHASMDVVFDQSWRHLAAVEREVLARLSTFRGGFTIEGARFVAGASLPVLGALVDRSLLRKEGKRLSMHPLVQRLAGLRLEGEAREAAERAHALYFHRALGELKRAIEDGDREALAYLGTEFENCRLAWRYARSHAMAEAVARSWPSLRAYCDHASRYEDAQQLLREMLEAPLVRSDPALEALLLASAAFFQYRLDRFVEAEGTAVRALALADPERFPDAKLQCLKVLGACALRLGRHEDARRYIRLGLKEAPLSSDPGDAAALLDNLALVEKAAGNASESASLSLRSLAEYRRLGNVAGEALCLNNLGALSLDRGDRQAANGYLRDALPLCERHGLVSTRGLVLANLFGIALYAGDLDDAARLGRRALEGAESVGNRSLMCWLRMLLGGLAARQGDFDAARRDLATGLTLAGALGRPAFKLVGISRFAEILAAQGEHASARRVLHYLLDHPTIEGPERSAFARQLADLPEASSPPPPWPGLDVDEFVHRIVVESDVAHAPLIGLLRSDAA